MFKKHMDLYLLNKFSSTYYFFLNIYFTESPYNSFFFSIKKQQINLILKKINIEIIDYKFYINITIYYLILFFFFLILFIV